MQRLPPRSRGRSPRRRLPRGAEGRQLPRGHRAVLLWPCASRTNSESKPGPQANSSTNSANSSTNSGSSTWTPPCRVRCCFGRHLPWGGWERRRVQSVFEALQAGRDARCGLPAQGIACGDLLQRYYRVVQSIGAGVRGFLCRLRNL